jgi:hypothetical protein
MMKGEFGFHRRGGEHETGTAAYVQIYVKSSALGRAPDLAISAHLMTEAEIDEFMDDATRCIGRHPHRCKEGASRGSFALAPKSLLESAEAAFRGGRATLESVTC